MSDDELNEHAAAVVGAAMIGKPKQCLDAMRTAINKAVQEERARCLALVKYRWTFDGNQVHTHTWHAMADTLYDIDVGTTAPKEPEPPKRRKKGS